MKHIQLIITYTVATLLAACSTESPELPATSEGHELYIVADLATGTVSRLGYDLSQREIFPGWGDIRATWEEGDIIRVYETDAYGTAGALTHVYHDYAEYQAQHPYPEAPAVDRYYRFECVDGFGTSRGVFKYIGLATAKVIPDDETGSHNVNVDISYNNRINNWDRFQGLVVYGNPLRVQMMRTQEANADMSHLKYGQRMYGYMCAHNFQWWFDNHTQATQGVGSEGLVLTNVGSCIYRVILGRLDLPVYGGSTLTISMPGLAEPMKLTLGHEDDYVLNKKPWCYPDPEGYYTEILGITPWAIATDVGVHSTDAYTIVAYLVGTPITLNAGAPVTVSLKEYSTGKVYQWALSAPETINFEECKYYTFDLRDDDWTVTTP